MLVLDGRPLRSYTPLYVTHGRIVGPVDPFVTRVAERMEYIGPFAVFVRGEKRVQIRLLHREPGQLRETYVPLVPLLRALGESVVIDASRGVIEVTTPKNSTVRPPDPFDPLAPQVSPSAVFTPMPQPTPRPVWTGVPRPRRTPVPNDFKPPSRAAAQRGLPARARRR
jgi:hypothetical protein